jgi:hypothetical protein
MNDALLIYAAGFALAFVACLFAVFWVAAWLLSPDDHD